MKKSFALIVALVLFAGTTMGQQATKIVFGNGIAGSSDIMNAEEESIQNRDNRSKMLLTTEVTDTVSVIMNDPYYQNRVFDETSNYGMIQLIGVSGEYIMNTVFYSQHLAGSYTMDDVYTGGAQYFALYTVSESDTTMIPFSNLLGATITGTASNCTAEIKYVGGDGVLYLIEFSYTAPRVETERTFTAPTLTMTEDPNSAIYQMVYGQYVYDFQADNGEEMIYGMVLSDNEMGLGTYTFAEGTVALDIYDATTLELIINNAVFSGTITIAQNEGQYTLSGSALWFGNIQYTFHVGEGVSIADVEDCPYQVYSEGRNIVLKGAQGKRVEFFDVTGRMVGQQVAANETVRMAVRNGGIYIVRVEGKTLRVVAE